MSDQGPQEPGRRFLGIDPPGSDTDVDGLEDVEDPWDDPDLRDFAP